MVSDDEAHTVSAEAAGEPPAVNDVEPPALGAALRWPRLWGPALAVSLAYAAYTGFRMPNLWSVTLYQVSLQDGFHRRFLVGTILHPFSGVFHHNYGLYAATAFAVLGVLLAVLGRIALKSRLASQRALVIAFLVMPTGGYMFHVVGYLDHVLYLLLFLAMWSWQRRPGTAAAPVLVLLALAVHEIAILSVFPVFAFVVLRERRLFRQGAVMVAAVAFAGLAILAVPPSGKGAAAHLLASNRSADFAVRLDALALFDRSQADSWKLYDVREVLVFLLPFLAFGLAVLFVALFRLPAAPGWVRLYSVLAVAAVAAPALLAAGGWDKSRWATMLVANTFIVLWVLLDDLGVELPRTRWLMLAGLAATISLVSLPYFDLLAPRALNLNALRHFIDHVADGTIFEIPRY